MQTHYISNIYKDYYNMYFQEIYFIEKMLRMNEAYKVDLPNKGTYICMSNDYRPNQKRITPIKYEEVDSLKKHSLDFVIWRPDIEKGAKSPYGQGVPSANLYVLGLYR